MKGNISSQALALSVVVLLVALVSASSWTSWTSWRPFQKHIPTLRELGIENNIMLLLSDQPANLPQANYDRDFYPWTKADDMPISYSDWFFNPPLPTARSRLTRHGARVACWPSTGGVYVEHADIIDMHFLGLNRFADTDRSYNVTAEDEFCTTLKMLGTDWWSFPLRPEQMNPGKPCTTLETCFKPDIKNELLIAWLENQQRVC
jgi:hypothetical protein